jgi:hypothetical protein
MFGFTLANFVVIIPYILAFFTMFNIDLALDAPQGADVAQTASQVGRWMNNILVLVGFLLGAMLWWLALTSTINIFRKGFRPRHMLVINRVAGVVISALGVITLVTVIIG